MSCIGFLSPRQRERLRDSSASDGGSLSRFASPPITAAKRDRVRRLATSPDPLVRESAALSYAAPDDVLVTLAHDDNVRVRSGVARNHHCAVDLLIELSADEHELVRGWAVANPAFPAELLEKMSADVSAQVRAVTAWAQGWHRRD